MRPRLALIPAIGSVLLLLALPELASAQRPSAHAVPASTTQAANSKGAPLRFITDGLRCTHGVCALGSGNVGANYGQDIAITGGSCGRPCVSMPVFRVVVGSLPPGLFMPSTYGCCGDAIGGTPSQTGRFAFTVQARDGAGNIARQAFSIAIGPRPRS
jgi:hypothetical protein